MLIKFQNNDTVQVTLNEDPLSTTIRRIYKHLQNLSIPFRAWDNPFYFDVQLSVIVARLIEFGNKIGIAVDGSKCLQQDQTYLNHLHQIYEIHYDGNTQWLDFHEHIHMCEKTSSLRPRVMEIDFREQAGMLEKPFQPHWLDTATTRVQRGDVFCAWAELGKSPYSYWENQEPNDIDRMCELAKPWLKLRPKIVVSLEDIDFLSNKNQEAFNHWWEEYHDLWCQHWNIPKWDLRDMCAVSLIGKVSNVDQVENLLRQNISPEKILLQ